MILKFGNLTVAQFEKRVGTEFTNDEQKLLESHRQDVADVRDPWKFHIFDDPAISITIGSEAMKACKAAFVAANTRAPFNRQITFYPLDEADLARHGGPA